MRATEIVEKSGSMLHYTDKASWNAIRAPREWTFKAHKPSGPHPKAAYFTTLPPDTHNLASRLRIPTSKIEYVFCFVDVGDLIPLPGDRGSYVFFFGGDYVVQKQRQQVAAQEKRRTAVILGGHDILFVTETSAEALEGATSGLFALSGKKPSSRMPKTASC